MLQPIRVSGRNWTGVTTLVALAELLPVLDDDDRYVAPVSWHCRRRR
jgi:hypothetical protein